MITKICGIKEKETLLCCEKKGVNFFGMIFYKKSPRNISKQNAIQLQKLSINLKINGVGVFVNQNLSDLMGFIKKSDKKLPTMKLLVLWVTLEEVILDIFILK